MKASPKPTGHTTKPVTTTTLINHHKPTVAPPQLTTQIVIYLDLLGFRAQMASVAQNPTEADHLLSQYHDVVGTLITNRIKPESPEILRYRLFTDNIVLAIPFGHSDGEWPIGLATMTAAEIQLRLSVHGWFVRGGIAVGDFYIDDELVFGPALVEAYDLESRLARDPRIILSQTVQKLVQHYSGYYSNPHHSPQNSDVLIDSDGQAFVNYLGAPLAWTHKTSILTKPLKTHRQQVLTRLEQHRNDPAVWSKYRWTASYHNFFCANWLPKHQASKLRIPSKAFDNPPHLLVS